MKKILLSVLLLGSIVLKGQNYGNNSYGHQGNNSWTNGHSTTITYSGGVRPSNTSNTYVPMGMSDCRFNELRSSIQRQCFDNTRLAIAKQGISGNAISSVQVRELMELLTFESNRLELAKFAYNFCVDRQQYFLVNDAFTFSFSIDELNRSIGCNSGGFISGGGSGMNGYGGGGQGSQSHHGSGHGYGQNQGGHCGSPQPGCNSYGYNYVTPAEFQQIICSIQSKSFDSSKLIVAQQIAGSRSLSSQQVAGIMRVLDFESTKLDFAKFAYRFVADPQNYFLVNDAFDFESSIRELQLAIGF